MPSFDEQLLHARKSRNMTQEELAGAINISRSRISRWENGNAVPDIETVKLLTQVLRYDFIADKDLSENELNELREKAERESMAAQKAAARRKRKSVLGIVFGSAAVVVVAALAVAILLMAQPKLEPYSLAWYQQQSAPRAGKAYVKIEPMENPTPAVRFEEFELGLGWFYTFFLEETNHIPFTVDKVTVSTFSHAGDGTHSVYGADVIAQAFGDTTLRAGSSVGWSGGFPLQDVLAVGLAVEGTDANGNNLTFCGHTMLSTEVKDIAQ